MVEESLFNRLSAREEKKVNIQDILNFIFRREELDQKTVLTNDNVNAIMRMNGVNAYCEMYYGFRLELFDRLIDDKRVNIISYKGRGRKDIIEAIKAMQDTVIPDEPKKGLFG